MKRPGPVRWVRYAFGGGLPPEYSAWVRHDTTCSTWVLRHLARVLVVILVPEVLVVVLLPTTGAIKALTAFVTGACTVLLTAILSNDMTERRLQKAGFPWGTGERERSRRSVDDQLRTSRERRERIAARKARRHT